MSLLRTALIVVPLLLATLVPLGVVADAPAAPVWGDVAVAKIRPGANLGGYCTFNFLFTDASGNAYIGTAAHCTDEVGERLTLSGVGQIATVVYDSDVASGANRDVDFSLAILDAGKVSNAHPQVLGWNGPTGIATRAELPRGEQIGLHGYGLLLGQNSFTRDRSGVIFSTTVNEYRADLPAVNGDSGAPLLTVNGEKAVGIISHYGLNVPPTTDEGPLMSFILAELAKAGFNVDLATV